MMKNIFLFFLVIFVVIAVSARTKKVEGLHLEISGGKYKELWKEYFYETFHFEKKNGKYGWYRHGNLTQKQSEIEAIFSDSVVTVLEYAKYRAWSLQEDARKSLNEGRKNMIRVVFDGYGSD